MKIKILLIVIVLSGGGYSYNHYFRETQMFSKIVGNNTNPATNLLIGLFDFDTGLTRYDVYHLAKKSKGWLDRFEQIKHISNSRQQQKEMAKLMSEMLRDSSFKKIAQKLLSIGEDTVWFFLKALTAN